LSAYRRQRLLDTAAVTLDGDAIGPVGFPTSINQLFQPLPPSHQNISARALKMALRFTSAGAAPPGTVE
jgi:hypothetical protein